MLSLRKSTRTLTWLPDQQRPSTVLLVATGRRQSFLTIGPNLPSFLRHSPLGNSRFSFIQNSHAVPRKHQSSLLAIRGHVESGAWRVAFELHYSNGCWHRSDHVSELRRPRDH